MPILNFEEDVLMRSQEVPVVVDFWAPWCGPCQTLGPVIEQLAKEADGSWELVKINTDENQEISAKYGIRGIPAVKMFYMGEVKAEFTGALPKYQIEKWLEEHLPNENRDRVQYLRTQLFTDTHQEAVEQLEVFVKEHPNDEDAILWLAAATVGRHPERGEMAVHETHKNYALAENVKSLAELMKCEQEAPAGMLDKITAAQQALKSDQFEHTLEALIEATVLDKSFCNELPRRATIALFHLLGDDHPLTKKYRRRFDMALY
ncbi:MAG: thioredoxin [Cyclobacteriaceae bacterium]